MTQGLIYGIPALIGFIVTVLVYIRYRRDKGLILKEDLGKTLIVNRNLRIVRLLAFITFLKVCMSLSVVLTTRPRPIWVGNFIIIGLIVASFANASIALSLYYSDLRLERVAQIEEQKHTKGFK